MTVTRREIEQFQRDGAIRLQNVFDTTWIAAISRGIARNMESPSRFGEFLSPNGKPPFFFDDYWNWRSISEFSEYVMKSPAAEIAGRLMGSTCAIFYHEHVLVKEAGAGQESPWHHDQPYYPVDGDQNLSIWMPLDPIPSEMALRFIRGSHRWNRWFIPRKFASAHEYAVKTSDEELLARYESLPETLANPPDGEVLCWPLSPGDCVVFHGRTLHSAPGNISATSARRALATRWLGDDARFAKRPWETSPPVTGGLQPGDSMACDEFPVVWTAKTGVG